MPDDPKTKDRTGNSHCRCGFFSAGLWTIFGRFYYFLRTGSHPVIPLMLNYIYFKCFDQQFANTQFSVFILNFNYLFDIDRRLNYGKPFLGLDTPVNTGFAFLGPKRREKR